MNEKEKNAAGKDESGGKSRPVRKSIGQSVREGSLYSAPTIIIVYPIVGFALGYMGYKLWGWPIWISMITMLLGLIQGIREIYKLSKKIYGDDGP